MKKVKGRAFGSPLARLRRASTVEEEPRSKLGAPTAVAIVTLGCDKNTDDTKNLAKALLKNGCRLEKNISEADAVILHTCSFIEAAKKESIEAIFKAAKNKKKSARLFVTGCLVQQHGKELLEEMPEVSAFLGTGQLGQIQELLKDPKPRFMDRRNPGGFFDPDALGSPSMLARRSPQGGGGPYNGGGRGRKSRTQTSEISLPLLPLPNLATASRRKRPPHCETWGGNRTAYLRLSEGCNHPCSFCVIPRLRGRQKSRSEESILKEARALAEGGVQELLLIGQDTGDWGRDIHQERRLPSLLNKLRLIPNLRWVRLLYMHPGSFTKELLQIFSESPEFFPYLDIPFQHINSEILADMRRGHTEEDLRRLLDSLHRTSPRLALRTTLIAGYPGETEKKFEALNAFVNEGHFDYLGAFAYSKEEGTWAARKRNQIPERVKQERFQALTQTQFSVAMQKARKRLGGIEAVLIDDQEDRDVLGRTRMEAPEIDAIVRINKKGLKVGQFIQVKLTEFDAYEFRGKVILESDF